MLQKSAESYSNQIIVNSCTVDLSNDNLKTFGSNIIDLSTDPTDENYNINSTNQLNLKQLNDSLTSKDFNILEDIYNITSTKHLYIYESSNNFCDIKLSDILRLRPEGWISNNIIDYYIERCIGSELQEQKKCIIIPSQLTKHLLLDNNLNNNFQNYLNKDNPNYGKDLRDLLKKLSRQFIIFIINCNNNHWMLCKVDIKEEKILFYDSLRDSYLKTDVHHYKKHFDGIKSILNKLIIVDKDWTLEVPKINQQNNSYDCGIHTIHNLSLLLGNVKCKILQLRSYIYDHIISDFRRRLY